MELPRSIVTTNSSHTTAFTMALSISQNPFHYALTAGCRDATLPVLLLLAMAAATLSPEKCCVQRKSVCVGS